MSGSRGVGPGRSSPPWASLLISDPVVGPSALRVLSFLGVSFPQQPTFIGDK